MLVNSLIETMAPGTRTFGFFEYALYGLPFLIATLIMYSLFYNYLVPKRDYIEDVEYSCKEIPYTPRMWLAAGIYAGVVFCMASGIVPLTRAIHL